MLLLVAVQCGPVAGALLLLGTGWPVAICNAVAAAITALFVPIPTIGMALLFFDLRQELAMESAAVRAVRRPDPPGTPSTAQRA